MPTESVSGAAPILGGETSSHGITPRLGRRGLTAVIIGNWFEFFDFIVYSFFAVMIGQAFFPNASPLVSTIASVATFGAGFITRPIGAAVIGAYADRAGRKPALALTLLLMAFGTVLMGLTPSYAAIGVAAPCTVVLARIIQGFAVGGEVGPATTYLLEASPPEQRARSTSWQASTQALAGMMGTGLGLILSALLSHDALYAWGWRVPFLLGIVVAPIGLYIRASLPETMRIEALPGAKPRNTRDVLLDLVRHHWRPMALCGLIITGGTIATYTAAYFTTYAITSLHLSAKIGMMASLVGYVASFLAIPLGARAVDGGPRKTVMIVSRLIFVAAVYPCFFAFTRPGISLPILLTLKAVLDFLFGFSSAGLYAAMAESFPQAVRGSGLSLIYAIGVTLFGATTQLVVTWLIAHTGNVMVPAWYMISAQLLTILGIVLIRPHAGEPA